MQIIEEILKPILEHIRSCDWKEESQRVFGFLKYHARRAGRIAARPLLQLWFVMTDEKTPLRDKALIYAALIYLIMPGDLLPRRVFKLLGVMDDLGALMLVYARVKRLVTPAIDLRVEQLLDEWFGIRCELVDD